MFGPCELSEAYGRSIGGSTIHSWAGIGLGTDAGERLLRRVTKSKQAVSRWKETTTLIIDESESVPSWGIEPLAELNPSLNDQRTATG